MARKDYMPKEEAAKAELFTNFSTNIPTYVEELGLNELTVASQSADAAWFAYILYQTTVMRDAASQWVNYKNLLLDGTGTAAAPFMPVLPGTVPASTSPGIVTRFRDFVRTIKAHPNYNESIGEALGIVGPEETEPDHTTVAPEIKVRIEGYNVVLVWKKGMMEGLQVQCDRGTGTWATIGTSLHPDFTDPEPFPSTPVTWRYRAIYIKGNATYGQLSNIAEVSVGG